MFGKVKLAAIGAAVGIAIIAGGYAAGRMQANNARDLQDARDALDTIERIQDAQADCAGLPWAERLRCSD